MAPNPRAQLESVLDMVLKSGDVQPLDVFLEKEAHEGTPIKCSQQFLTKLDKLIIRSLDEKDVKSASLGFTCLYKCGKYLKLPGAGQGLSSLITQGLIKKMVQWFEKCKQLWIQCGPHWDETLLTLSENFLNALMTVHETCKEGTCRVTESFLYSVGQLAVDPRIYILIQKEAIRKYNLILDKIPVEIKKNRKILTSQEASDFMTKLAGRILEGGDYDLQSSLMEALCRMATPDQRKKLADQWFRMGHVASAFAEIIDSEFETACRRFLNMVNGMQGDKRSVHSFPCLEVYLGKYELLMPSDEKLEEFWIDFNLGSQSISFYFSLPEEEEGHWETICINKNEVQSYTVTVEGKMQVLEIKLSEVVVVESVEGSSLTIHFSSSLDILKAACNIYGYSKNKLATVVKTAVKTANEENNTQVVPESQVSVGNSEKNTAPYILSPPVASAQMVTPARMKISESSTFISSSGAGELVLSGTCLASKLSTKDEDKSSLEKFCSHDKTVRTCSSIPISGSTNAVGMKGQKKSVAEAIYKVAAGQREEKPLDHYFVPDTQPRTGRSTSSTWSKLSVSDVLMMPTQKISSLPRSERQSSLAGQQDHCPSIAQKVSVSDSNLVLQKQFHREVTQRLQLVLIARNQDLASQEPTPLPRKITNTRGGSRDRSLGNQCGSALCSPKVQQFQRKDHTKEEHKDQMSLEADVVSTKASEDTTKTMQERISPKIKDGKKTALSSKQKRDAEVAGSMVKLISSHYKINTQSTEKATAIVKNWPLPLVKRPIFNMSWKSNGKKEKSGAMESYKKTTTKPIKDRKGIFEFNIDSPISIAGEKKQVTKTSARSSNSIKNIVLLSTTKNKKPESKKWYVKKHLFSDTDTDNATTDVSWLRESTKKPKPKVTKYARQPHVKPKVAPPLSPHESPDLLPLSPKAVQNNDKPSKKKSCLKKALDPPEKTLNQLKTVKSAAAPGRPHATSKRPKRIAATSLKSYREPDTDDSQSETERTSAPQHLSTDYPGNTEKACVTAQTKEKKAASKITGKMESVSEMQATSKNKARAGNVLQETSKLNKKNIRPAEEQMSGLKDSLAASQTSFCQSPPSIEKMRAAKRSAPTLELTRSTVFTPRGSPLPPSPKPPCKDTPSPILLLPKLRSAVSSKGKCKPSSFYSTEKNHSSTKTKPIQSVLSSCSVGCPSPTPSPHTQPNATEMCAVQQHLSSAPQSPLSPSTQPLLTSTLLEQNKPHVTSPPQPTFHEDIINHSCPLEFCKVSSGSLVSLSQSSTKSSVLSRGVQESATAALTVSVKSEKTPFKDEELELTQHLVSGPNRKRHNSLSSNSEEDEKEKKKKIKTRARRSPRMKPRKLFKSFADVSTVDEFSQVASSSNMSSAHWEPGIVDENMGMSEELDFPEIDLNPSGFCQQLSSEIKNKFQFRCKMLEIYNKQSSKTVQQHVSSISLQLTKHRTQKLEQIQKVLLEEIHIMEQDDNTLKSMEKDLTMHWKKQTTAFHSYQKQEIKRNETLGRILQSQACRSLEHEEGIFTSEVGLIKKDMKSVQDRFLKDMLEGEIQSVKRGLHTLFFP
ncbi:synaptonemal complex protein 2 [Melanotaenia boesemani]|uniref:synaptonemal complex protein 2 n=1 Tax=Melanotaenia boesemani TaxID=1250792 RepID=UPI001C04AADD|nr:synaptonemal complex protein 2 [Melanotaenia boesemani]